MGGIAMHEPADILLSLALILLSGFVLTRFTKKIKLPDVTGYIIAGILIGPDMLGLVPEELIEHMDFVSDVALAFIAFGGGAVFPQGDAAGNGARPYFADADDHPPVQGPGGVCPSAAGGGGSG